MTEHSGTDARAGWVRRFHAAHLHDYNPVATTYWVVMVTLGAALLSLSLVSVLALPLESAIQVAAGVACATVAGLVPIRVPRSKNSFAVGEIFIFLLLLLHGPHAAVVAAATEAGVATLRTSRRLSSRLASPALASVALSISGHGYEQLLALARGFGLGGAGWTLVTLLVAAGATSVLNVVLQTTVFALKARRLPVLRDSLTGFGWIGIVNCASAAVSGLLYFSFRELGPAVLLIAVPIIVGLLSALHMYFRLVDLDEQSRRARVEAAEREAEQAARHLAELQRSEQRFQSAFSHAAIGMALVGSDGLILQANGALAELLGTQSSRVVGSAITGFVTAEHVEALEAHMRAIRSSQQRSFGQQLQCLRDDGQRLHVAVVGSVFADDAAGQSCLILQLQDITPRVLAEQRLQHIAFHDGLTQLANRGHFLGEVERALDHFRRDPGVRCAVLYLDFDRFKLINDSLGHNIGDGFLREVAARLQREVPAGQLVARLGGDEFAVLLRRVGTVEQVEQLAVRLQAAIRAPMSIEGHELHTSASIGIRVSDASTLTPQDLLRDADTAMYRAKAAGKARHCLFDAGMHAEALATLRMEQELRQALIDRELTVALQPIVEIGSGRVVAFEAFARWPHPRLGMLSADRFVRLAEDCGLGRPLNQLMLEQACRAIYDVCEATRAELKVQINISMLELCQPGFAKRTAEVLRRSGLAPPQLWLEVAEAHLGSHGDAMTQTLNELAALGVGLCLDDFGTGYSALSRLSTLPIQQLKVDGRLVRDPGQASGQGAAILRALVQLGKNLGLSIVAEGVESAEQLAFVRSLGCHYAQGYHFGPPRPAVLWPNVLRCEDGRVSLVPEPTEAGDDRGLLPLALGAARPLEFSDAV